MFGFDADPRIAAVRPARAPVPAGGGEHAEPGAPAHQDARPEMRRPDGVVELPAGVLPPGGLPPDPQTRPIGQRVLVLAAAPEDGPEPRTGPGAFVAAEREPEEVDGGGVGRGVDVGVRGGVEAEPGAPAPPRAHRREEAVDVGGDRRRRPAGEHALEVLPRQAVVPLQEERPRELQAHPHESGPVDQDRAERRHRLGQQGGPPIPRRRPFGGPDGREADEEPDVGPIRVMGGQRTQDRQRFAETAALDQ